MDCPKCGAFNENPVGSCLSCGASLPDAEESMPTMAPAPKPASRGAAGGRLAGSNVPPKQCPSCSTLNAATFKFCARCGTPLGATGISLNPPAKPAPAPASKPAPKPAPARAPAPASAAKPVAGKPAPRPAPPPPPAKPAPKPAPPPPPRARARISAIARDGSTSADFVLTRDETRVGSQVADGEVKLDQDPFIGPVHAIFKFEKEQLTVRDAGTHNGVFIWLKARDLNPGDELRVGRQRLRVEWMPDEPEEAQEADAQPLWGSPNPGYVARAVQLLEGGGEGDVYPLKAGDNMIGRGAGDISFPGDGYVSSKHAKLSVADGAMAVQDLGSANGTFVRINESSIVNSGDLLLVGEQILRIDPA